MPPYDPGNPSRTPNARRLVAAIAAADALVIGSPAYHGTVSGLVKNALDHVEDLRDDARPYFSRRAVGCVAVGQGWQGAVSTLGGLRDIVHALRGWPTPLGVALNGKEADFDAQGECDDPQLRGQLATMGEQLMEFAEWRRHHTPGTSPDERVSAVGAVG